METKKTIQSLFCDFLSTAESQLNEGDYLTVSNALKKSLESINDMKPKPQEYTIPCDFNITIVGITTLQLIISKVIVKWQPYPNTSAGWRGIDYISTKVVGVKQTSSDEVVRYETNRLIGQIISLCQSVNAREFIISHKFLPPITISKADANKWYLEQYDEGGLEGFESCGFYFSEIFEQYYIRSNNVYSPDTNN